MKRRIRRWASRLPGDHDGPALPHIAVIDDDDDEGETATHIHWWSSRGERAAERIARDLAACGVALVYPGDADLRVFVGEMHRVIEIGAGIEVRDE